MEGLFGLGSFNCLLGQPPSQDLVPPWPQFPYWSNERNRKGVRIVDRDQAWSGWPGLESWLYHLIAVALDTLFNLWKPQFFHLNSKDPNADYTVALRVWQGEWWVWQQPWASCLTSASVSSRRKWGKQYFMEFLWDWLGKIDGKTVTIW